MTLQDRLFRFGAALIRLVPNRPKLFRTVIAYRWARLGAKGSVIVQICPGTRLELDLSVQDQRFYYLGEGADAHSIAQWTTRESVFVDIGANIGFFTCSIAPLVKQVVAFEPLATNIEQLNRNIVLNGLANVDVYQVALSSSEGQSDMFVPPESTESTGWARLSDPGGWDIAETVSVARLDDIFNLNRLDLMKIDVEGHEREVLNGATLVIGRFRPYILCEVQAAFINDIVNFGDAHDYDVRQETGSGVLIPLDEKYPPPMDVWLIPRTRAINA